MKRILLNFLVLTICLISQLSNAQNIADHNFAWQQLNDCSAEIKNAEIFVVVEQSPKVNSVGEKSFQRKIEDVINKIAFEKSYSNLIKVKVNFSKSKEVCVSKIGSLYGQLTEEDTEEIAEPFRRLTDYNPGKQRGVPVDCQSTFYIKIEDGKFEYLKPTNIRFKY